MVFSGRLSFCHKRSHYCNIEHDSVGTIWVDTHSNIEARDDKWKRTFIWRAFGEIGFRFRHPWSSVELGQMHKNTTTVLSEFSIFYSDQMEWIEISLSSDHVEYLMEPSKLLFTLNDEHWYRKHDIYWILFLVKITHWRHSLCGKKWDAPWNMSIGGICFEIMNV